MVRGITGNCVESRFPCMAASWPWQTPMPGLSSSREISRTRQRRCAKCIPWSEGNLIEREAEVLCLLAQGRNTPQIAQRLDISKKTVEHHLAHIYDKLGVTCRTAAVVYAVQQGLV